MGLHSHVVSELSCILRRNRFFDHVRKSRYKYISLQKLTFFISVIEKPLAFEYDPGSDHIDKVFSSTSNAGSEPKLGQK